MVSFRHKGDFKKTSAFLENAIRLPDTSILDRYGKAGVAALASATPVDTGTTAGSWSYKIEKRKNSTAIVFYNSNIQNEVPIAIILQYGHATGTGGWVEGRDYINPAIQPIFDKLSKEIEREVSAL